MLCPFCKKEIPDNTQYCPYCGLTVLKEADESGSSKNYWQSVEKEAAKETEKRIEEENKATAEKRRKKRTAIVCLIGAGIAVVAMCYFIIIMPEQQYQKAVQLYENGKYQEASDIFESLGNHKDSSEMISLCNESIQQEHYQNAVELYESGQYEEALSAFEELDDFSDSTNYKNKCQAELLQEIKPVYEWRFDNDLSETNGTESTVYGNTELIDLGNTCAATFDGDGDYISCGTGINMGDAFTFNAVIRCRDIYKDYSAFFAKYETNSEGPYAFSINQGYVNCWITDADGYYIELESETKLENNRWYCVSIVRDGDTISMYIDGELEKQDTIATVMQNSDTVTIGRQALMFDPEDQLQFTGYIDSIAIYDCVLDANQISMLSDTSLNGDLSDSNAIVEIPPYALSWNGHYYACYNNCSSWEEAEKYCESIGGHLAVITSSDENNAVFNYLLSCGFENGYIGFSDNVEEGTWYWVNGETSGYTNWHSGEPNAESSNEDYAMFYYKFDDGTWNDGNFGNGTANDDAVFICEWD